MRYKDVANRLVASPALPIDKKTAFDAVSMAVVVLLELTSTLPVPSAVPINHKCWCCDWPIGDILVPHRVPPKQRDNGRQYLSPASYTLSKEEKESMFDCLSNIKVPSGYSSNIKGILNLAEKKFTKLKFRDCHVLMTELLPLVLRGILSDNIWLTIVKLCVFLNTVSQKIIDSDKLIKLQNNVVQFLVKFAWMIFSEFFPNPVHD